MSIKNDEVKAALVILLQTLWLIFSHQCGTVPLTLQAFLCTLPGVE